MEAPGRYTERAARVLALGQLEARDFGHNYVGPEHLLLGLVREGDGIGAKVLVALGAGPEKVRSALAFVLGRGDGSPEGKITATSRARTPSCSPRARRNRWGMPGSAQSTCCSGF